MISTLEAPTKLLHILPSRSHLDPSLKQMQGKKFWQAVRDETNKERQILEFECKIVLKLIHYYLWVIRIHIANLEVYETEVNTIWKS